MTGFYTICLILLARLDYFFEKGCYIYVFDVKNLVCLNVTQALIIRGKHGGGTLIRSYSHE